MPCLRRIDKPENGSAACWIRLEEDQLIITAVNGFAGSANQCPDGGLTGHTSFGSMAQLDVRIQDSKHTLKAILGPVDEGDRRQPIPG